MSYVLGLTGSIGMGKSTTSKMFLALGHPVWSADEAVHSLYAAGGEAVAPVSMAFPGAIKDGAVDRQLLKQELGGSTEKLERLEALVHPLLAQSRNAFVIQNQSKPLIVFDIPLLFEKGLEKIVDGIAVVSTTEALQRARVLSRPGMTEAGLEFILSHQLPDAVKREKADWVIPTDDLATAEKTVKAICEEILGHA